MSHAIDHWLKGLGLSRYSGLFAENEIGLDVLPELTEADLKDLGIPLGDRKRLLKAIASLTASPEIDETSAAPTAAKDQAERRQLTVMFCDLVGSTAISRALDPEDYRGVMRSYQEACAGVVGRYEGHVAKFLGDGVLAYFGYPRAHEDDAERSVRAGLEIVKAVAQLEPRPELSLEVRVGIATGLVVVGDMLGEGVSEEGAVSGETPNLAARLQVVAAPGTVVVSEATRRLAGGHFEFEDLRRHELKGFSESVAAARVTSERKVQSRFEAAHGAGLTALVGREPEISLLMERWRQAKEGEPGRLVD